MTELFIVRSTEGATSNPTVAVCGSAQGAFAIVARATNPFSWEVRRVVCGEVFDMTGCFVDIEA